ncbi:GntR family transcriptional regulator [Plantactinospora sp. BC1]|uniref:MocR-like pyridoxine biosynthesis transcription factor PdxR n=1 Tax=Plantactinospora sp. BC1 TaxID=2108470 RepID=UPI000D16E8E9|nr:PLP-dependent aminotransferase family protein [Plantactinospora sp. BC1]AVT34796.1 GntR family transcriptional regulator [Plantactinospora sp. BC1]
MEVHVRLDGPDDLTTQIYRQLRESVLDARLRPGERLPPTRELAERLGVARNTVAAAYDRLTAEGFLVGRVGSGTYVGDRRLIGEARPRTAPVGRDVRPRPVWESVPETPRHPAPRYDFRVGFPDPALFPLQTWRRLVARQLRAATVRYPAYTEPAGHPGLRAALARHVGVSRSVRAGADDVLVTQGAQQALDLIGRVLIEPGDRVAVEEPGYPPARRLFRTLGARVTGVPVDSEGLVVAALPADSRLVYVTPSHQFPLGVPMSLARRTALLDWAERHGAVVVEDDYDSEYRFADRPLEPLQSLDRHGRVVYVGSFSKTLLPMLRVGFLVAPASLRPALRTARQLTDWHGDLTTQGALAEFIDEGLLARHIRRTSREYGARRERILAALAAHLAGRLHPVPSAAGLHLAVRPGPDPAGELAAVAARARECGVAVESLAGYCAERPAQPGLVIGYGGIALTDIDEGIRRLAAGLVQR